MAGRKAQRRFLEQPEEFEDDHDNENHSNYVKEGSAHAGAIYIRVSARWPALLGLNGGALLIQEGLL
jgi:hypothetical protein